MPSGKAYPTAMIERDQRKTRYLVQRGMRITRVKVGRRDSAFDKLAQAITKVQRGGVAWRSMSGASPAA